MNNNLIIEKAKKFITKELEWLCSAHDIYHIERVYDNSMKILKKENSWDEIIVWLWALLHEMLDEKFYSWQKECQVNKINKFLNSFPELTKDEKEKIIYIIDNIWYWKSLSWKKINKFIEFQIVEDADRLEAIWAIAIARTFAYWWKVKRSIYDPNVLPNKNMTCEQYYSSKNHSINHFYEKLLKLKDVMNTKLWKEIAEKRHKFMEKYLEQFFAEWNWEK